MNQKYKVIALQSKAGNYTCNSHQQSRANRSCHEYAYFLSDEFCVILLR